MVASSTTLPMLHVGVGLARPSLMLRAMWSPVEFLDRPVFDVDRWWQATALVGSGPLARGFGWAAGVRTSRFGLGPVALAEYNMAGVTLRLEGSCTMKSPWAPEKTEGQVLTLGLGVEPNKTAAGPSD